MSQFQLVEESASLCEKIAKAIALLVDRNHPRSEVERLEQMWKMADARYYRRLAKIG